MEAPEPAGRGGGCGEWLGPALAPLSPFTGLHPLAALPWAEVGLRLISPPPPPRPAGVTTRCRFESVRPAPYGERLGSAVGPGSVGDVQDPASSRPAEDRIPPSRANP